jgi:hypothetical protein
MIAGLCATCKYAASIQSHRGSTFLRCDLSFKDPRFAKYPRLPVLHCDGWRRADPPPQAYDGGVPEHEIFYAIRQTRDDARVLVSVSHEVPEDAQKLGAFPTPGQAIDFALEEVRRLNGTGASAEYVEPPDDLVGAG